MAWYTLERTKLILDIRERYKDCLDWYDPESLKREEGKPGFHNPPDFSINRFWQMIVANCDVFLDNFIKEQINALETPKSSGFTTETIPTETASEALQNGTVDGSE